MSSLLSALAAFRAFRRTIGALLGVTLLIAFSSLYADVFYVKTPADGGNDANSGLDWDNAKETVTGAVTVAADGDEIRVAAGTYAEHIVIDGSVKNVALYGGFTGTETARDQRDVAANETILDGTLSGTVVIIEGNASALTRIDGFSIVNGKPAGFEDSGGGIRIVVAAPVIANNLIRNNETNGGLGGGIFVFGARVVTPDEFEHPVIRDNRILENLAFGVFGEGGGIALQSSDAEITNNIIARNQANQNGGGILVRVADTAIVTSDPRIIGNVIIANTAGSLNPWMVPWGELVEGTCWKGGGGIFAAAVDESCTPVDDATVSPMIANNLIAANGAYEGGGVLIQQNKGTAIVTNNTIVANSGAGVFWEQAGVELVNNLVAFNTAGFEQSIIGMSTATLQHNNLYGNELQLEETNYIGTANATGLSGNISADPGLADYQSGHFHIQPESACVDAGDNGAVAALGLAYDIEGDLRNLGGTVDIGADESNGVTWNAVPQVVLVHPDGDDAADGLTWPTAKATVGAAIAVATEAADTAVLDVRGGEIRVAGDTEDPYYGIIKVPAFVHVYGGFNGSETDLVQRDPEANQTTLDGDGEVSVVRFGNNGYRVSRLDGFVVQHGGLYRAGIYSPFTGAYRFGQGGGILVWIGGPEIARNLIQQNAVGNPLATSYPTEFERGGGIAGYISTTVVTDNTVQDNEVWDNIQGIGGAMYFRRSWPTIVGNTLRRNHAEHGAGIGNEGDFGTNVYIAENVIAENAGYSVGAAGLASAYGGGIWCWLCGDFVVERNVLRENFATEGSGIYIAASPRGRIESNVFEENNAEMPGDYVFAGGGLRFITTDVPQAGDIRVVNNTFVDHEAQFGGAISMDLAHNSVVVANNVIADNSSGIHTQTPSMPPRVLDYNLFHDNGNDYVNLTPGPHDLFADPAFVDDELDDYRLATGSPAIEAGSPVDPPLGARDLDAGPRIQDADHDGTAVVDIGAYEFAADFDEDGIVDWQDPDDDNDGMPDEYETAWDFNPFNAADADEDYDEDGYTNVQEYLARTDPCDPDSHPRRESKTLFYFNVIQGAL